MLEQLHRLYEHLAWADDRVLAALAASADRPPRAVALYAHVLGAEHVWLARLRQVKPEREVWPTLSHEQCATLTRDNQAGFGRYIDRLDEAALGHPVNYTNSAGAAFRSRVDDILMHVAMHGSYHRGQVAQLMREAGFEPSPTDYIAFARGAPAATRQG